MYQLTLAETKVISAGTPFLGAFHGAKTLACISVPAGFMIFTLAGDQEWGLSAALTVALGGIILGAGVGYAVISLSV